ncbi:ATP-dependent helicase HrpB [Vibrio hannami]|uniref:ATP-dependent helicase HrpB n=1 Tax=Vibrio hannami TaxID=2717094 RepID=UPI002410772C|nr:ATP-dependent helicase HrpB [Vibrio hannami]MDG3088963.1 ATP-dependent helicase HrpB [Vibrio hannami]
MSQLPIESVITELLDKVQNSNQVILKAAPGAGKSTYFPLQLVKQGCINGKIIMLEPRRLAARNIATYLSSQLGEKVGQSVGYRVRGDVKVSSETKLEIVTEGIMTNMIQSDPELTGVGLLIFDEYHERSIHADTALAFSLEVQEALRDDLKIVVMSATLDSESLQMLMPDSAYIESEGRAYPVEQRYSPMSVNDRLAPTVVRRVNNLLQNESGSILVFLPGVGAIKQVELGLRELSVDAEIAPLYGQLSFKEQEKAILPAEEGKRKVVLSTNIAETSLTIEGIRIVVDSGLERVARFDLKTGITKLEQVRIAQSSAIQRAGRAGRLEPGICVRLFGESQYNQQPKVPEPEILHSDLSSLAMELALWGANDASELKWLDIPPSSSLNQARELLQSLELLTEDNQCNENSNKLQSLGIEPRLGAMLIKAEKMGRAYLHTALALIPLLEEPEKHTPDITHSLYRLQAGKHPKRKAFIQRAQSLGRKLGVQFDLQLVDESCAAVCLAFAFPDRIAKRRNNQSSRFLLVNGHGAFISEEEPLAGQEFLVAADLMRTGRDESQLFLAAGLDVHRLQKNAPELFFQKESVDWDEKQGKLVAEKQSCIGHSNQYLVIESEKLPEPDKDRVNEALINYVRRKSLDVLNWDDKSRNLRARIACAREWMPEEEWPLVDDKVLLDNLENWLEPYMNNIKSAAALKTISVYDALLAYLGWPLNQKIDEWLPVSYQAPTGSKKKIVYSEGKPPVLSIRMQEMFGEQSSPLLAKGRVKLTLELLSPAQRPLQLTSDLAGFWAGAYKEVQKEMKGRYPKHPWPDDPASHIATTKTKRQLNS